MSYLRHLKKLVPATCVIAAGLAIGCGGNDDDHNGSGTTSTTAGSTSTTSGDTGTTSGETGTTSTTSGGTDHEHHFGLDGHDLNDLGFYRNDEHDVRKHRYHWHDRYDRNDWIYRNHGDDGRHHRHDRRLGPQAASHGRKAAYWSMWNAPRTLL